MLIFKAIRLSQHVRRRRPPPQSTRQQRPQQQRQKQQHPAKKEEMKLDPTVMRTMSAQDFRVLEAVEKGMQKHALVPAPLIASLSSLRHGGTGKILSSLLRDKLLSHDQSCGYDGYRLTNAGYDVLALWNLKSRKIIAAIGDRIGTGKESDIYLAVSPDGRQVVLKFHRLGRTSFRNVKKTRDYFVYHQHHKAGRHGGSNAGASSATHANSWLFLSRKSALKEFAFMKALYNVDYPTPEPLGQNRHVVAMSLVRGVPLYQVQSRHLSADQAASIFHQAAELAVRLAKHGLVHCDLNEFNLLVDLSGIQQKDMSQEHDPYVRHSGMSVVAESAPGMLSARGPWEPVALQQYQPDHSQQHQHNNHNHDETGSHNDDDAPPKPTELLEDGQPKPVVTLIDFPQMVSTQHPNAKELYERDTACLYKFFTHKLQFRIPESDKHKLHLTWESVQEQILQGTQQQQHQQQTSPSISETPTAIDDGTESVCLASKAQLRLDQQLKASGYSEEDSNRDSEFYYYYNNKPSSGNDDDDDNDDDGQSDNDDTPEEKGNDRAPRTDMHEQTPNAVNANDDIDDLDSVAEQSMSGLSLQSGVTNSSRVILNNTPIANMSREQLHEQAKERVKQQLEAQKRKGRQRGAFRKHNSNKSYLKGKRVYDNADLMA